MAEYLAAAGDNRTGEIRIGPDPSGPAQWVPTDDQSFTLPDRSADLAKLFAAAEAVDVGAPAPHHLHMLYRSSADVGGARPKARVMIDARTGSPSFR